MRMTDAEFIDAVDGLYAYDIGAHDSGIHDKVLQEQVRAMIAKMDASSLDHLILQLVPIDQGYSLQDVENLREWLHTEMGAAINSDGDTTTI